MVLTKTDYVLSQSGIRPTSRESFCFLICGKLSSFLDDLGGMLTHRFTLPLCRHPELVPDEIVAIQAMFDEAKSKGWLKK